MTKVTLLAIAVCLVAVSISLSEAAKPERKNNCPKQKPKNVTFEKDAKCEAGKRTNKTINGKPYTCTCKCAKAKEDAAKRGRYCRQIKARSNGGGTGTGSSSGNPGSDPESAPESGTGDGPGPASGGDSTEVGTGGGTDGGDYGDE